MKFSIFWRRVWMLTTYFVLTACGSGGSGQLEQNNQSSNKPPAMSGSPPVLAKVGQEYLFEPSAYDPDGDTLTFSISNRPEWATFSPISGRLHGIPTADAQPAYPDIQISVTDGKETVSLPAFKLTVEPGTPAPGNSPPSISGTPATSVIAGNAYEFVPTGIDRDGQVLAYSIVNRPDWAQFDSVTGRLSGKPAASEVGVFADVTISVSDGQANASLPAFGITVLAANSPPRISGTPTSSVAAGQTYSFTPTASDLDGGQMLFFSIANQPSWATFDSSSGSLSGTPTDAQAGTYFGITISVSDGIASASLPSFGIVVAQSTTSTYFTSSFETGDKTEWNQSAFGAGTMTVANSDVASHGNHYVRAAMVTGSANSNSLFHDYGAPGQVSTQFRDYWFQFAVSVDAFTGPWVTNKIAYVQQYDSSQGDSSFSNSFRDFQQIIAVDSSGRYFVELADIPSWRFVALSQNTVNGTSHSPTPGSWDVLRMQVVLDTAAGGEIGIAGASSGTDSGNGILRLWKNGMLILEYTNLNLTKATPTVAAGRILLTPHNAGSWAGSNTYMYWDDVRVTSDATLLPAMPGGPIPRSN